MNTTPLITVSRATVVVDQAVMLAPTTFQLEAGRGLAVTGTNGSGKTTLLSIIAGSIRPSSGTVTVAGEEPDDRSPAFRARVAALMGLPPLARNLTLREHLALVATSWGASIDDAHTRADDMLQEFGIARLESRFPHEMSSGETQLFALALTLIRPFDVLLLDEPEKRLDSGRLGMVGAIIRARIEQGATVIMASHNRALVEQVADQALTLTEEANEPGA